MTVQTLLQKRKAKWGGDYALPLLDDVVSKAGSSSLNLDKSATLVASYPSKLSTKEKKGLEDNCYTTLGTRC